MGPVNPFEGKMVCVLGGCGFIGSNFIHYMLATYPDVEIVNMDALTYSGNPANLADIEEDPRYTFIQGDIAEEKEMKHVIDYYQPDYVINFAAETHVDRSIHVGSKEFIRTNVEGVYNILEAVKNAKHKIIKYVQVSTDEVYGQLPNPYDMSAEKNENNAPSDRAWAQSQRFTRNSIFKPNVPYSATKAAGDCLCNAYHHTWDVPVVVTHCSNNYGPYQYPEKMVPFWATRLLKGEKIPMYGDGMNIRDWIHVDDHVRALVLCLLRGEPGKEYLIGADNERTNMEMAGMMVEIVKGDEAKNRPLDEYIEIVKDRPGHDRRYAIDHSDITRELGWVPKVTADKFAEKLKKTLDWYKDHQNWVEEIIKRTGVSNPHIQLWKGVMDDSELNK